MAGGPGTDAQRSRWLVLAVQALYGDIPGASLAPVTLRIDGGDEPVLLVAGADGVHARPVAVGTPAELVLTADPGEAVGVLAGQRRISKLSAERLRGPRAARSRLQRLVDRGSVTAGQLVEARG